MVWESEWARYDQHSLKIKHSRNGINFGMTSTSDIDKSDRVFGNHLALRVLLYPGGLCELFFAVAFL
jgi:hypothetical protein